LGLDEIFLALLSAVIDFLPRKEVGLEGSERFMFDVEESLVEVGLKPNADDLLPEAQKASVEFLRV
jgi:hypothetical protein